MKIFLVEDSLSVGMLLTEFLTDHDITWAKSLGDARWYVERGATFDAVILDMQLPDGNGTEMLPYIYRGLPTCLFTAAPHEAKASLNSLGREDVPVFDKMDYKDLFEWIEGLDSSIDLGREGE